MDLFRPTMAMRVVLETNERPAELRSDQRRVLLRRGLIFGAIYLAIAGLFILAYSLITLSNQQASNPALFIGPAVLLLTEGVFSVAWHVLDCVPGKTIEVTSLVRPAASPWWSRARSSSYHWILVVNYGRMELRDQRQQVASGKLEWHRVHMSPHSGVVWAIEPLSA